MLSPARLLVAAEIVGGLWYRHAETRGDVAPVDTAFPEQAELEELEAYVVNAFLKLLIERFTRCVRERVSPGPVRATQSLRRSLIDRVEVDDREVRIAGRKDALEHAILATGQAEGNVHGFVPNWRPRQDLNLRPSD